MTRHFGGRLPLSAIAIPAGLADFLPNWSATHLYNENRPLPAKRSDAQTMAAGAFLAGAHPSSQNGITQ